MTFYYVKLLLKTCTRCLVACFIFYNLKKLETIIVITGTLYSDGLACKCMHGHKRRLHMSDLPTLCNVTQSQDMITC